MTKLFYLHTRWRPRLQSCSVSLRTVSLTGQRTVFSISLPVSLVVSASQFVFQDELLNTLAAKSPEINPASVLGIGASDVQKTFRSRRCPLDASYMKRLHMAFVLATAVACAAILMAAGQGCFRLKTPGDENGKD